MSVRVLYIMGVGRSGSTFLDTVLGNHPEIESVGELIHLPRNGWINGGYCACGERGNECPFWCAVRQEWSSRVGVDDVQGYQALQNPFERFRHWPRLLKERWITSSQFRIYSEQTYALFEAISTVSKKSIIVDSSKYPVRAFALSMMPGIDLYLIHLVRDVRGVAWSHKKAFSKNEQTDLPQDIKGRSVWNTAVFWSLLNLLSEWVISQLHPTRSIRIYYEDFTSDYKGSLEKIENLISCNFTKVSDLISAGYPLEVGHTIAGNRLRLSGDIRLRPDMEWMQKMPETEQRIAWSIAGWLLKQYGYNK